jgi:predicted esterase
MTFEHIHQSQPVARSGAPLEQAKAAMILVHGRGASAENILMLAGEFGRSDFAYLAPQAAGSSWYPLSFLSPIPQNEPGISSGLQKIDAVLKTIADAGVPPEKTVLLGFSQGACLSLEYAARNPRRYGAVVALSGGLIGPDETPRDYEGSLDGTPVFLGCSDIDFHIPLERVNESTGVMKRLGGDVTERIYPSMGHTVNADEIAFVRDLMHNLVTE